MSEAIPDVVDHRTTQLRNRLRTLGWHSPEDEEGFAVGQPRFVFQLPLTGQTEESLLAGMNRLWRRNIKKAAKAGAVVTQGVVDDLAAFHALYVETAERDGFTPRPLSYFQTMFAALLDEDPDRIRLYLAHHEEDLVAATTWVRVGSARLVLLRGQLNGQAGRTRVERDPVADDHRRTRGRCRSL